MATPRPKVFRAVVDFSTNNVKFRAGDVVTGLPLATALRYGDRFVTADTPRKRQSASAPVVDQPPATEPSVEGEKE